MKLSKITNTHAHAFIGENKGKRVTRKGSKISSISKIPNTVVNF